MSDNAGLSGTSYAILAERKLSCTQGDELGGDIHWHNEYVCQLRHKAGCSPVEWRAAYTFVANIDLRIGTFAKESRYCFRKEVVMNVKKKYEILLVLALSAAVVVAVAGEKPTAEKPTITLRTLEPQVVLYRIYRGPYEKIGPEVGKLYALAGKNQAIPKGQPCYVYLNNPNLVSSSHYLTEIRIPVGKDAMKLAGTLGDMTDVKELPAMEVAVAVKPEGVADPSPIYDSFFMWLTDNGYRGVDSPMEVYLTNVMTGDYASMRAEIMVPVVRTTRPQNASKREN